MAATGGFGRIAAVTRRVLDYQLGPTPLMVVAGAVLFEIDGFREGRRDTYPIMSGSYRRLVSRPECRDYRWYDQPVNNCPKTSSIPCVDHSAPRPPTYVDRLTLTWGLPCCYTGNVVAVAAAQLNGRPVAVSGSNDTTVRVWDLTARRYS